MFWRQLFCNVLHFLLPALALIANQQAPKLLHLGPQQCSRLGHRNVGDFVSQLLALEHATDLSLHDGGDAVLHGLALDQVGGQIIELAVDAELHHGADAVLQSGHGGAAGASSFKPPANGVLCQSRLVARFVSAHMDSETKSNHTNGFQKQPSTAIFIESRAQKVDVYSAQLQTSLNVILGQFAEFNEPAHGIQWNVLRTVSRTISLIA